MSFVLKVILSGLIVALASEAVRISAWLGGLIVSLPLISLITAAIVYWETHDAQKVANFLTSALWGVIPPLIFFIMCPLLIKHGVKFWPSMGLSIAAMLAGYLVYSLLMKKFGA